MLFPHLCCIMTTATLSRHVYGRSGKCCAKWRSGSSRDCGPLLNIGERFTVSCGVTNYEYSWLLSMLTLRRRRCRCPAAIDDATRQSGIFPPPVGNSQSNSLSKGGGNSLVGPAGAG
eukprot:8481701-Pyramimonas_sp.AAC.2